MAYFFVVINFDCIAKVLQKEGGSQRFPVRCEMGRVKRKLGKVKRKLGRVNCETKGVNCLKCDFYDFCDWQDSLSASFLQQEL